jgi:2-oxoisovalerate dehydrogenase E1 component beta subunit
LQAISDALGEEMRRDPNVILLGEDIGVFGGAFKVTRGFLEGFGPDRVIDTPVSESGFVGAACAAAIEGLRPVVEFQFADFIACAFDQIVNYAAKAYYRWGTPVPVVFRAPSGGGFRGGPYHSQNPEAWFTHVPGLKVVQPSTPYDAKGLLKAAIRDNNPVIYFEHKHLYRRLREDIPEEDYIVPLGVADIKRVGRDLTIVTYGAMVHETLAAADRLSARGAECEVIDLRSLCPLDKETFLASVRRTARALIVHEAHLTGGFGAEVAAIIAEEAFDVLDAPVTRVASLDVPVPFSPPLEDAVLPNADRIFRAAVNVLEY